MRGYTFKRFYASFNPNDLSDDQRDTMAAGVLSVAATSPLVQGSPAMQASVSALGNKVQTFKTARNTAATSQAKADADAASANTARRDVDAELFSFINLGLAAAQTAADLTGAGIAERPPAPAAPPLGPPDQIDVRFFKSVKGRFKVTPHGFGKRRLQWAVQMSQDPSGAGPWAEVYGSGNSRTISGASGSKVWVRYAMIRNGAQSTWSTPVLVTIP